MQRCCLCQGEVRSVDHIQEKRRRQHTDSDNLIGLSYAQIASNIGKSEQHVIDGMYVQLRTNSLLQLNNGSQFALARSLRLQLNIRPWLALWE